ncbi:MAG: HAD-IIB family hydrolase [Desulfobacterales bacterium]|jgi:HAD superfamily hydrolase (TIGR01484 family)
MTPFDQFPRHLRRDIRYVLTDIDDTLTHAGRLPAAAYASLEKLARAGLTVVPITGRPAGWCDHMARMWPIAGIVGENGAFYFTYDPERRRMVRRYWKDAAQRRRDRARLDALAREIPQQVPGCRISADQAYREADLAVDFCEDVAPLSRSAVEKIVGCFEAAGAQAKISSIHVNGWFGEYDKLAMTTRFFTEQLNRELSAVKEQVIFCGDSPNDAPMFAYFPHSVGMANVTEFIGRLDPLPTWVTAGPGGRGFAEMCAVLLDR